MIIVALVAVAVALPVEDKDAQTLFESFEQQPDGPFISKFETENGIKQEQEGQLKEALDEENKPQVIVAVGGFYSYPGAEGKPMNIKYYADETGYHAEGNTVPKAATI